MYSDVSELPSQVLLSLGEGAPHWMEAYNSASGSADERRLAAWEACAELPSSFSFEMVATADRPDRDGEVMDVDDIERCMDGYIRRGGPVQLDHGNYTVGTVWGWEPSEVGGRRAVVIRGNLYGGGGVYERVRSEFARGLRGASVAGESGPPRRVCGEDGCHMHRGVRELMEISVCRVPSNPAAVLLSHHPADRPRPFAKSLDLVIERVDMGGCPVRALASRLSACGVPCVVTSEGPVVPMREAEFEAMAPAFAACGLSARWSPTRGGAVVGDKADAFARLLPETAEWLDSDAEGLVLSPDAPPETARALRDAGLLADGGRTGAFAVPDMVALWGGDASLL